MRAPAPFLVPLLTIFAMQSVLTMAAYAIPIVIPVAAPEIGMPSRWVGYVTSVTYGTAMVAGLASGPLLGALGPTRVFQMMLAFTAAGALVMGLGSPVAVFAGAILIGCATGPMNPSGSHVLAGVTAHHNRALVFSVKQCGTPSGGILAGALLPAAMALFDWRIALALVPLAIGGVLMTLAPYGQLGGVPEDREGAAPGVRQGLYRSLAAVRDVLLDGPLRTVTLIGLVLAICQMGLATFLVVYLWQVVGFTPAEAGLVFSTLHVAGITARLVLGYLTDRLIAARLILGGIALTLGAALAAVASFDASWSTGLVLAVIIIAGASGNGWVGLFFAELARLAPPGRTADVAGGSQFIMYIGIAVGPMLYGLVLAWSGSYRTGFVALAMLALAAGLALVVSGRKPAAR